MAVKNKSCPVCEIVEAGNEINALQAVKCTATERQGDKVAFVNGRRKKGQRRSKRKKGWK